MKHFFLINIFTVFAFLAKAQDLRSSLLQYQMNALPLNPAYSSYEAATGFEATYLGNFISQGNVSRTVLVNMQGATEKGGVGLTFQFYQNGFLGELNLRPSWSRRFSLENGGEISYGIVAGLNYFDVANSFFSNNSDFFSFDAGFGVYYRLDRFFAGVSVLNLFEKTTGLDQNGSDNPDRENPYSLHAGGVFRLTPDLELKPVALLRYIHLYTLPDQSFKNVAQAISIDLQANVFIQNSYIVGVLFGYTGPSEGMSRSRYGISAGYVLGKFRLTYALQNNVQSNISLPVTHLISAGYDISGGEMDGAVRYF